MERAIVMTGLGGQGIQLIAKLLAQAGIDEGREIMTFGIFHGMIRGGSSESTVVLADQEIVAPPIVPEIWAVVAMHGEGLPKLAPKVRPGGVLVTNAGLVANPPSWHGVRHVGVPAAEIANQLGLPLAAGMVILGAVAAVTGVVALASLHRALDTVLPPHRRQRIDDNRRALTAGVEWAAAYAAVGTVPAWAVQPT